MVVTLTTCKNEFEAELIKGNLEANGIKSILQGSNISQVYGGIGGMEVNVLVDQNDYDKAKQLISDAETMAESEQTEQKVPVKEKSLGKKIVNYLIVAVVIGVLFALLTLLSCYLFDYPVAWKGIAFQSVIFGLVMPYVLTKIDRHYNKEKDE